MESGMERIDYARLARAIQRKMEADGLTYEAGAEAVGISTTAFFRAAKDERAPNLKAYVRLCSWLGVSMDTFRSFAEAA